MLMIIGDMNAKVGTDNANCHRAMGKHRCGDINDNGEHLVGLVSVRIITVSLVVPSSHTRASKHPQAHMKVS